MRRALEPVGVELLEGQIRRDIEAIPPMPELTVRILAELNKDNSSAGSVAKLAALDPALVASLLRTANSSAYSPARPIRAVSEAVAFLGYGAVRSLLMRLGLKDLIGSGQASAEIEEIWTHAVVVSQVAERLGQRFGADRSLCATLGLLHDLGKLVIVRTRTAEATKLATPGPGDESRLARERRVLGADHADIGAHLAARWRLPADVVEGIRHHHAPHLVPSPDEDESLRRAVAVVFVANQIAKCLYAYCDDTEIDIPHDEITSLLRISPDPADLVDEPIRRAVTDALLLAAVSLGRVPGATSRLIRITPACRRNLAVENALLAGDATGLTPSNLSASSLVFRAAGGDAHDFHSASAGEDALARAAIERQLIAFSATPDQARRLGLALTWLTVSLRTADPKVAVDFVVSRQGDRVLTCIRSDGLRFDRRLGAHVCQKVAVRVLEGECAGVINLSWFTEITCSSDGGALLLAA